ncbi:MAG: 4-hydroxy-tetrahydrodipicolinate synthase [Bacteroidia bacterium]|jgi:4-hydroxy-tetrahydrodipicolinate synthase
MTFNASGTGVALVTPFTKQFNVDHDALKKLCIHVINGKVDYLVVLGTTGESVTLSETEKQEVIETVYSTAKQKIPLVLGLGGNNTHQLCNSFKTIDKKKFSAVLSVAPYYNKPNASGYYQHYKSIVHTSPLPIILYNVPGRTGSNMSAEIQLKLAHDFKSVIATKEASGNLEQMMHIFKHKPKSFQLICGDDNLTLPAIAAGASGVISVVANAFPAEFSAMVAYCRNAQFELARNIHYKFFHLIQYLFADGNPGGIKVTLQELGICKSVVRLPLAPPHNGVQKSIRSVLKSL